MVTKQLSDLTDHTLILLLKQGNKEAFEKIYNRYWSELTEATFKHLHSLDDAKEVVQDVFISLYVRRDKLEITRSLGAYLNTAVKYKALNHIRSEKIRKAHIDKILYNTSYHAEDPAKMLYLKELDQQINYTVASLPKKCREVYTLSREGDLSYRDIAEELGISVSTVEKHIVKALKIIRLKLHTAIA